VPGHGRRAISTAHARASLAALLATALLGGCGGSSQHTSSSTHTRRPATASVCTAKGRTAVAGFLEVGSSSVSDHAGISSAAVPTCYFTIKLARGRPVRLSVMDERTVEAYFLLERAIVEFQQVFAPVRLAPAPETVPHLGLDASWFPAQKYVMTTDGVRLITATVDWPSAPQWRQRALATAAARAYLGPLDYKAAENS
jgi:hypothetical protein